MIQEDIYTMQDPSIAQEFADYATVPTFLGSPIFEADSVLNLIIRFLFNLFVGFVLVRLAYYPKARRKDWYVTFMLFSSTMFLLIFLMENVKLQIGFTLGLFAIFGMIRYRTETLPIREMTYLFIIIAQAVMNSLSLHADSLAWHQLLFANIALIALAGGFELWAARKRTGTKVILYEKIDNIRPENREALLADLKERTGLEITDMEIGHIDFLRDVAYIKIKYQLGKGEEDTIGTITKFKQ